MSDDNQEFASSEQVGLFRVWAMAPRDFENTPPQTASSVYGKLFPLGIYIEPWAILNYLKGKTPMPYDDFKKIEAAYMCESSADRDEVRRRYR